MDNQKGAILWLTGLSGSGKTTIARQVHWQLSQEGILSHVLDGDVPDRFVLRSRVLSGGPGGEYPPTNSRLLLRPL